MSQEKLILGTRGSDLALTQTRMVQAVLKDVYPDLVCETKIISTIGDERQDIKLTEFAKVGVVDKGVFTKELEVALAAGEIDVAVHSLKDVPTELDKAFHLKAVLLREDTRDVLLTTSPCTELTDLPDGASLATSSVRRQAQLQWLRNDLAIEEIRGNVPTRLRKLLQNPALDGILLALAGLKRLGYVQDGETSFEFEGETIHLCPLGPPTFLPAAGQGAIALETRASDTSTHAILAKINDADTFARVDAERLILDRLQAGCHTPVGIDTELNGEDLRIHLRVFDEHNLTAPPKEADVSGQRGQLVALVDQLIDSLS